VRFIGHSEQNVEWLQSKKERYEMMLPKTSKELDKPGTGMAGG
jgi:hypothetical protein